jgi:hypothetical protein
MSIDEQIAYMRLGRDALENALLKDKALKGYMRRRRMMQHLDAHSAIVRTLERVRGIK